MRIIGTERIPIKMWLNDVEDGALEQAKNLANLPFSFKHIAIMPDCHQGYGMPIGGVMATKNIIIPNAVGVDIGCGMCTVKTSLRELDKETIKKIFGGSKENKGGIRARIPVGRNRHSKKQDDLLMPDIGGDEKPICSQEYESARKQIGTLGGGNHFLELQCGTDGHIWIMIHSGSRNLGFKVANHYNKIAEQLNEKWYSSIDKKLDLAFLPFYSKEGQLYFSEMQYCVDFALANRKLMMENAKECILEIFPDTKFNEMINIAHNYAVFENHFGENVIVHRKGATKAYDGQLGIIPGSQGTASYIVRGKGNKDSFMSCSHGAGRKLSRTQAQKILNIEEEKSRLDSQGIVHSIRTQKDLDEASGAYKDIDEVMENQKDLIDIVVKLTPLGVIKG